MKCSRSEMRQQVHALPQLRFEGGRGQGGGVRPQGGGVARIAYNLNADLDLRILMFDITGQNVWTARCLSGTEGGKAGYNEVVFDARSQLSGAVLGNGIYVYKLVAGNKVIGTGYITIND